MFSKLANLASIAKQAAQMQGKMAEVQENLKKVHVSGTAGGGMVIVEANGHQEILACRIEPEVFTADNREMLEDLIVAATNQAMEKAREAAAAEMSKLTGGLDLSGMKETLSKFGLGGGE